MQARQQTPRSFGAWLRQRRRALDLTQADFGQLVGCSVVTVRKLEDETRRPSKQIAERLADILGIATADRAEFLRFARGDPFAAPAASAPLPAFEPGAQLRHHNLPLPLNSFVGREKEMAARGT